MDETLIFRIKSIVQSEHTQTTLCCFLRQFLFIRPKWDEMAMLTPLTWGDRDAREMPAPSPGLWEKNPV